jgi:hypothetical protein
LFLLFPASVEPVVWCSGLQDVLSTTTALVFVNEVLGRGRLVLLAAAFAGALLSKESAVGTPFIAAALVYARDGRIERPLARSLAMGAMVAIVFGLWRLHTADPAFAAPPSRYLLKQILSMALGTLNVPWTTGELRNAPVLGISMAALVAVAGLLLVRHGQRARAAPLALALFTWTIVAVLPVYSMFFVANDLEGSRYLYFASAGWALLLALTASSATGRTSRIISSVLIVLVLLWSATVVRHLATWIVAAAERDRLLAAAALALQNHPCAEPRFVGATDSIAGAFVFRNGLDAALRRRGIAVSESATSACRFVWSGTEFVPSP